jgi:uncharacterized protein (DUF433 family)
MNKARDTIQYNDRIISDPRVLVGKPIVKGTRIPVELVLERLAANPDIDDLFVGYPRLTMEDVQACLDFARSLVERKKPRRRPGADAARTLQRAV